MPRAATKQKEARGCRVCGRKFETGRGAALGLCVMHYRRALRNHPRADDPEPLHAVPLVRCTVLMPPERKRAVLAHLRKIPSKARPSFSAWAAEKLWNALQAETAPTPSAVVEMQHEDSGGFHA